jgi:hypothetical protein
MTPNLDRYIIRYKPTPKAMEKVEEIFKQDDGRYVDPWKHIIAAGFIAHHAISITSKIIKSPKIGKIPEHKGPQKELKRIAAWLLRETGFNIKGCEIRIPGGVADMIGASKEKQIVIECGPCRIDKPIDYLENPNNILWILTRKNDNVVLHEIKRGKNWKKFLKFHKKESMRLMQEAYEKAFEEKE